MRTNLIKPKNISEAKSKTSKEYVTELVPKLFAVNPNLRLLSL